MHTLFVTVKIMLSLFRQICMFQAALTHHQGVNSCIKQSFKPFYHFQYVEELSQLRQCVISGRWICAVKIKIVF
jgi:hypothetical protein